MRPAWACKEQKRLAVSGHYVTLAGHPCIALYGKNICVASLVNLFTASRRCPGQRTAGSRLVVRSIFDRLAQRTAGLHNFRKTYRLLAPSLCSR